MILIEISALPKLSYAFIKWSACQKKFTAESSSVFVVLIEQIIMEALEVVETSSVPSQGTILSS